MTPTSRCQPEYSKSRKQIPLWIQLNRGCLSDNLIQISFGFGYRLRTYVYVQRQICIQMSDAAECFLQLLYSLKSAAFHQVSGHHQFLLAGSIVIQPYVTSTLWSNLREAWFIPRWKAVFLWAEFWDYVQSGKYTSQTELDMKDRVTNRYSWCV